MTEAARIKELETAIRQLYGFLPRVMQPQVPEDYHRIADPEGVLMFADVQYVDGSTGVHVPELRSTLERLNLFK